MSLVDEWKENVAHVQDGMLSSHNKEEILSFAATGMELENIGLSEISWAQKGKYNLPYLYWKLMVDFKEKRIVVTRPGKA